MVEIGNGAGRRTIAVISDMDEPLGYAVGNALEVKEAIDTLRGEGPKDLTELCLTLGSQMLLAGGFVGDEQAARARLMQTLKDGSALAKFAEFVTAQGGDASLVEHPWDLPKASLIEELSAPCDGYLTGIACDEIGRCSLLLGGGRERKEDVIDLAVGVVLAKKKGDVIRRGERLATIYANDEKKLAAAKNQFYHAITIEEVPPKKEPFIKGIIA